MVYLTFIIDHYATLPDVTIFHHASQYQWHNDDPDYDASRLLGQLQIPYVLSRGYANLRCVWTIGCPPDSISPHKRQQPFALQAIDGAGNSVDYNELYKAVYEQLFPSEPVPEHVGAPCCAQFAVTANTILQRPVSEYEYFRKWLLETDLADEVSGRIMEYFWHIIFQRPALDCLAASTCYCSLYGLCDLHCEFKGVCLEQWQRPKEMQ